MYNSEGRPLKYKDTVFFIQPALQELCSEDGGQLNVTATDSKNSF
jgi:hypothetical protein